MCSGCYRDPSWSWWLQPLPAFTMLFLVPIYSFLSTMANLQSYHSRHAPVMVSDITVIYFPVPCLRYLSYRPPLNCCSPFAFIICNHFAIEWS